MNVQWVRIRSWHIISSTFTSRGGLDMANTACGRRVVVGGSSALGDAVKVHPTADDRPGNEKSCEMCYRIAGPK